MQMSSPRERATTSAPSGTRLDRDCNHALERLSAIPLLLLLSIHSVWDCLCLNFLLLHANGQGRSGKKGSLMIFNLEKKTVSGALEAIQSPTHSRKSMRKWKWKWKKEKKNQKRKSKMSFVANWDSLFLRRPLVIHTRYIGYICIGIPVLDVYPSIQFPTKAILIYYQAVYTHSSDCPCINKWAVKKRDVQIKIPMSQNNHSPFRILLLFIYLYCDSIGEAKQKEQGKHQLSCALTKSDSLLLRRGDTRPHHSGDCTIPFCFAWVEHLVFEKACAFLN